MSICDKCECKRKANHCEDCGREIEDKYYPPSIDEILKKQIEKGRWNDQINKKNCLFDGLKPGIYGLVCQCGKCNPFIC